jgi:ribosomal protein L12E/L44/L45/RPP1/RPP2
VDGVPRAVYLCAGLGHKKDFKRWVAEAAEAAEAAAAAAAVVAAEAAEREAEREAREEEEEARADLTVCEAITFLLARIRFSRKNG